MNRSHYGHCVAGIALATLLLVALGVPVSTIVVLATALVCPLMMLAMIGSVTRDSHGRAERGQGDHDLPR